MTQRVVLNNVDHGDLTFMPRFGAAFGHQVNSVRLFPTEYVEAAREYAILFRHEAETDALFAVALLGLDRDENLFLDATGWHARHIPALHQRGPFRIGMVDRAVDGTIQRELMLHVDLDHPRVGAPDGQPVFLPHGGQSPYLDHVVTVLRLVHDGLAQSAPMFAAFEQAELIEPITLDVALDAETHYTIPDCFTIGPERLAKLDPAALEALHRAGFLAHAFRIVSSLGNVAHLIELKNRKRRAAAGTA